MDLVDKVCIFNPGFVHLSEKDGTMLLTVRLYFGQDKPCTWSKVGVEDGGASQGMIRMTRDASIVADGEFSDLKD